MFQTRLTIRLSLPPSQFTEPSNILNSETSDQFKLLQNPKELQLQKEQLSMHKGPLPNPHPFIFKSITPSAVQIIQNDSFCLQSIFYLDKANGREINVSISNFYIAIFTLKKTQPDYLYEAEMTFDLKFETIYQSEGQLSPSKQHQSKPIGFRLIKEGEAKIQLYSKYKSLTALWIKQLSRHLNQYGFHFHFNLVKKIGKGGFANVYQVQRVADGKHFAVKSFSKASTIHSQDIQKKMNLMNEIQMLRTFDSPNIIRCEGIFESENSVYIVLELLKHGQLHSRINQTHGIFSLAQIRSFIKGMALGLREMHYFRIMHRDIKPENIMMRDEYSLVPIICDFGLSADVDSDDYIFYRCGTPGYVAPQIISLKKGEHIQPECDIFSLGAILHIMLVQKQLFEGKKYEQIFENNKNHKFNLSSPLYQKVDSQAMDLLRRMLKINPKDRIKAEEILSHPFLKGHEEIKDEKYVLSPTETQSSAKADTFSKAQQNF